MPFQNLVQIKLIIKINLNSTKSIKILLIMKSIQTTKIFKHKMLI